MRVTLVNTGKPDEKFVNEGIRIYEKRIAHYCTFKNIFVNPGNSSGKLPANQLKLKEAGLILEKIKPENHVVLLDERGKQQSSVEMANWLQNHMIRSTRHLVFVTGGAYGFHESVNKRANEMIALSRLTFPHQLVRLVFLEQLYRWFSIIRGEPYHNE
jgi:23S rRNA (pseudouridine1915-N3)-methyltransferase